MNDPETPVLAPSAVSECRCGARYDEARFNALRPPPKASTWTFGRVTFAVRQCRCGSTILRRTS